MDTLSMRVLISCATTAVCVNISPSKWKMSLKPSHIYSMVLFSSSFRSVLIRIGTRSCRGSCAAFVISFVVYTFLARKSSIIT